MRCRPAFRLLSFQFQTKFAELLPRVEDVLGLAACEHTPSAADYLAVSVPQHRRRLPPPRLLTRAPPPLRSYYAPFELVLDSELVWPLPQPLEY